jgi:septum formation protein
MSSNLEMILASGSPRRKHLLEQINCTFRIDVSDVEERVDPELRPAEVAESLARQKAQDVAQRHQSACIIGADTIVVLDEHILGKPESTDQAKELLRRLSDQSHQVITGVCLLLLDPAGTITSQTTFHEQTGVTFGALTDREIDEYVATGSPMDKAGAYGIQDDWGSLFVKEIQGDYNNVVGFPLYRFYQTMKSFAPELLPHPVQTESKS